MGLVFALQPDVRRSTETELTLKSSKRRFSMGGMLIFAGALLGTMYLAAAPLFRVLMSDGTILDRILVGFIYLSIYAYPIIALYCWFFEEVLVVSRSQTGEFAVKGWSQFLGFKWSRKDAKAIKIGEIHIENWKGAVNMAALENSKNSQVNRYATRGHWMLSVNKNPGRLVLEKRAKREDVELLFAQIKTYFKIPPDPKPEAKAVDASL